MMLQLIATVAPEVSSAEVTSSLFGFEVIVMALLISASAVVLGMVFRGMKSVEETRWGLTFMVAVGVASLAVASGMLLPKEPSGWVSWAFPFFLGFDFIALFAASYFFTRKMSRQGRDRIFHTFCLLVTGVSVLALVVMLSAIGYLGWEYLSWDLLSNYASRNPDKAGVKAALWGTVWISIVCGLTAIPIGTATAIYLEEYSRKGKLYRFIDLNISNLAGVPSIVYGIIGLTIFARMFGFFGPINEPHFQVGSTHYAVYLNAEGNSLNVPLAHRDAEDPELSTGTKALDSDMNPITLSLVPDETTSTDPGAIWKSDAVEPIQRYEDRSWFYLQLPFGGTVLAGGFTLALVVLPIVIVASREAIRAVPPSLREAALGCGATRWQMVRKVTLPAATPGIMTGSILAVSRAMGEAAPLLVLTGILFIRFTPEHLMDDFTSLPLQIYNWAGRPQEAFHAVAASGIVVLLVLLLAFNAIAVVIRQCFQKPLQ